MFIALSQNSRYTQLLSKMLQMESCALGPELAFPSTAAPWLQVIQLPFEHGDGQERDLGLAATPQAICNPTTQHKLQPCTNSTVA